MKWMKSLGKEMGDEAGDDFADEMAAAFEEDMAGEAAQPSEPTASERGDLFRTGRGLDGMLSEEGSS